MENKLAIATLLGISALGAGFSVATYLANRRTEQSITDAFTVRAQCQKDKVYRIVLTGGPCGGKSTALALVADRLASLGFRVFRVPEGATLLITGGINPGLFAGASDVERFQESLMGVQMALEDAFIKQARATGMPSVVLCDRGLLDNKAYMDEDAWQAVISKKGWTEVELRDVRYDGVLHLMTAAIGAEGFYTTANNAARSEGIEQAAALDCKLREAWVGHPKLRVIDNSTPFMDKINRAVKAICEMVGQSVLPSHYRHKYRLQRMPAKIPCHYEEFALEMTFLLSTELGTESRLIKRSQHGSSTFTIFNKKFTQGGERLETERPLNKREYGDLVAQKDPRRKAIKIVRKCFLHECLYFMLDQYESPHEGLTILQIESDVDSKRDGIALPKFVLDGAGAIEEVTEDPQYCNLALSLNVPLSRSSQQAPSTPAAAAAPASQ